MTRIYVTLRFLLPRLMSAMLMVVLVSMLVFVVLRLLPIDPVGAALPPGATEAERQVVIKEFGLDRPVVEQYARWANNLLHGKLGTSINLRSDVGPPLAAALPATLELVGSALVIGVLLGGGSGLLLFAARGTKLEPVGNILTSILVSVPEFVWAILGILLFGVWWPVLPFIGRIDSGFVVHHVTGFLLIDSLVGGQWSAFGNVLMHLVLPATALSLAFAPMVTRILRSSLLSVILEDFVHFARLRGLGEREVLMRHALRNAALPTLSLIGVQAGFMFGGTLLVEAIFGWPGLGNLMVTATRGGDIPMIQGAALIYCLGVLVINLFVDLFSLGLNPRLRAP
jgi:ABC-type dipeptide/oligopeptide/nickel transport system permease component